MEARRRIVVGLDGSEGSRTALQWAVEEAVWSGATLVALTTWTALPPPIAYPYAGVPAQPVGEAHVAALGALKDMLQPIRDGHPTLSVEPLAVPGDPAKILVEQSKEADLVVVGARGHGGIGDWLLGSVSQNVVQHARCSVAVIR
jgi:nucleotide-binding universal stress UspA family protein